uniref:hypothetical protein n=1 Tax=Xanthomonas albilineans TaxID=29447 RepID=UPI0027DD7734|nr:hypothetical protein [Xanthomonas albilineans]
MAWYTLTYACGHTEQKQLYGKTAERERTINSAQSHDCPACRLAAAKTIEAEIGLPPLSGSDKQITWAAGIRAKVQSGLTAMEAELDARWESLDEGKKAASAQSLAKLMDAIRTIRRQTRAGWWIDWNKASARELVGMICQGEDIGCR